jgi:hypothetical protein
LRIDRTGDAEIHAHLLAGSRKRALARWLALVLATNPDLNRMPGFSTSFTARADAWFASYFYSVFRDQADEYVPVLQT